MFKFIDLVFDAQSHFCELPPESVRWASSPGEVSCLLMIFPAYLSFLHGICPQGMLSGPSTM